MMIRWLDIILARHKPKRLPQGVPHEIAIIDSRGLKIGKIISLDKIKGTSGFSAGYEVTE